MYEGMENLAQIEAMGRAGHAVYAMPCENYRLAQAHLIETLKLVEELIENGDE
jgi:hypothetical protein